MICFVIIFLLNLVDCQIISQSVAKVGYSKVAPTVFGQSILSFPEIIRQRSGGNQIPQVSFLYYYSNKNRKLFFKNKFNI